MRKTNFNYTKVLSETGTYYQKLEEATELSASATSEGVLPHRHSRLEF